ncbi:MAG: hypothetical protein FJ387_11090 [Verrucomicrobia bacterium]|nr:hypothetical protein [Verrucomicrobiota bacterium]
MIRLNLLAEEQAAEQLRRRDPVKRATWVGALAVGVMVVWAIAQQFEVIQSNEQLTQKEAEWRRLEKPDQLVRTNRAKTISMERRLAALERLSTNRFLWSGPLNALQFALTQVGSVQVTELVPRQTYKPTKEIKDERGAILKPKTAIENTSLIIRARDFADVSAGNHTRFMEAVAREPYFRARLQPGQPYELVEPRSKGSGDDKRVEEGAVFGVEFRFVEAVRRNE